MDLRHAYAAMSALLELARHNHALNARLPVVSSCADACRKACQLAFDGAFDEALSSLHRCDEEARRLAALCGHELVRIAVGREYTAGNAGDVRRSVDLHNLRAVLEAAIANWDATPDDGTDGMTSVRYMLFGGTSCVERDARRFGDWVAQLHDMLTRSLDNIAAARAEAGESARLRQLEDAFRVMKERARLCREAIFAAKRVSGAGKAHPDVLATWARLAAVLRDGAPDSRDAEVLADELNSLSGGWDPMEREPPNPSIDCLMTDITAVISEYPEEMVPVWLERGLRGLAIKLT